MDAHSLGRYLRETREAKELTLDEAEQSLRIRARILESFELGDFTVKDASAVQIRGFIRNYARYLGLDEDRVVAHYDASLLEAQRPRRNGKRRGKRDTQPFAQVGPRSITDTNPSLPAVQVVTAPAGRRRGGFLNTLALLLVAVAAVAVIVFVAVQLISQPGDTTAPESGRDILVQLPSSPTFTLMPTIALGPTPTPLAIAGAAQAYDGNGVLVTINMVQRSWLRIATDGVEQFTGVAVPDQPLEYRAANTITITASNAEALIVTYNGQPQGAFGGRGQKVDITFTMNGVQVSSGPGFDPTSEFSPTPPPTSAIDVQGMIAALTPSSTPGPSPTASDTPTITPTPSITLTPSDTPTITPTPTDTAPPTNTLPPTSTPTATRTPLPPTPTAVLPPRVTQEGLPPTKPAG